MNKLTVIGGGLAGCEAAWQAAERGVAVRLYEMKPQKYSPAHHAEGLSELVCSNSLKANEVTNACGLLKEEMRRMGSIIIEAADATRVPAGGALAVDRDGFSAYITQKIERHPNITVVREEKTAIPESVVIVATGPLTEGALAEDIARVLGEESLHFYDAAAPIVAKESINMEKAYFAARYNKGTADYINCPMTEEEYNAFYEALISAERAPLHENVDKPNVFEGCMPVEVMAARGRETLTFGPLKPVGLPDPKTGREPYAVVQLRQDDAAGALYNMVGFQTNLKWGEQKRVFSMIPGLECAEFLRYGVMHRNSYLSSPDKLTETYRLKGDPHIYFAGQITGVEGYVESADSGMVAGINAARQILGKEPLVFPKETVSGALSHYVSHGSGKNFQPMNANFGILPPLNERIRQKRERYQKAADRSLAIIDEIARTAGIKG